MNGAHTSSPVRRTQSLVAEQQSARCVQRPPSGTHALAHEKPPPPGKHSPPQHSRLTAQDAPSALHATTCSQRSAPALAESMVHASDCGPQHCASAVHGSPAAPHPFFAQRFTPPPPATHDPEQQSASLSQSSHSGVQPPSGAQRRGPSFDAAHIREQQSSGFVQTSPATREQPFPSTALHIGSGPHRPPAHVPEQQS